MATSLLISLLSGCTAVSMKCIGLIDFMTCDHENIYLIFFLLVRCVFVLVLINQCVGKTLETLLLTDCHQLDVPSHFFILLKLYKLDLQAKFMQTRTFTFIFRRVGLLRLFILCLNSSF